MEPNSKTKPKITILEETDRNKDCHYPNDSIRFDIQCRNDSGLVLNDVVIEKIMPSVILPYSGNKFAVDCKFGEVRQTNHSVKILIKRWKPDEILHVSIMGRIGR